MESYRCILVKGVNSSEHTYTQSSGGQRQRNRLYAFSLFLLSSVLATDSRSVLGAVGNGPLALISELTEKCFSSCMSDVNYDFVICGLYNLSINK